MFIIFVGRLGCCRVGSIKVERGRIISQTEIKEKWVCIVGLSVTVGTVK